MMRFQVVLEQNREGGYTATCVEIAGAIFQGETKAQALDNVREAIELVLDVRRTAGKKSKAEVALVRVKA